MEHLATVELYQRTILGGTASPRDETKLYVFCPDDGYPGLYLKLQKADYDMDWYRGYVVIRHPEVMAGSWDDCIADFKVAAQRKLVELNLIHENEWGVYHWV